MQCFRLLSLGFQIRFRDGDGISQKAGRGDPRFDPDSGRSARDVSLMRSHLPFDTRLAAQTQLRQVTDELPRNRARKSGPVTRRCTRRQPEKSNVAAVEAGVYALNQTGNEPSNISDK